MHTFRNGQVLLSEKTETSEWQRRNRTEACPQHLNLELFRRKLWVYGPASTEGRFPSCHLVSACSSLEHRRASFGNYSSVPKEHRSTINKTSLSYFFVPYVYIHAVGLDLFLKYSAKESSQPHRLLEHQKCQLKQECNNVVKAHYLSSSKAYSGADLIPGSPQGNEHGMTFHSGCHNISVVKLQSGLPDTKNKISAVKQVSTNPLLLCRNSSY